MPHGRVRLGRQHPPRSRRLPAPLGADGRGDHRRTGDGAHGGALAQLPAGAADPSEFVALPTTRVLDTREGRGSAAPVAGGNPVAVDGSAASYPPAPPPYAAYVSATATEGPGFVTAYPCGTDRPTASSANYTAGATRGAVTIVRVGPDGTFCLYTLATARPARRRAGRVRRPRCAGRRGGPPADPARRAGTPRRLHAHHRAGPADRADRPAVPPRSPSRSPRSAAEQPGYLVAYPCAEAPPLAATVNHAAGETVAGAAFVPVSPDGTFCVWSLADTDVVVDLTATLAATPGAGLAYVPVARCARSTPATAPVAGCRCTVRPRRSAHPSPRPARPPCRAHSRSPDRCAPAT